MSILKAPPMSRVAIKQFATRFRRFCRVDDPYFPVDRVLEAVPCFIKGYSVEIEPDGVMGDNHGLTDYLNKVIRIREDVYDGACEGKGRDRMTCAHEIGHAILHTNNLVSARSYNEIKTYEDPEWQAMAFAGHLLIPDEIASRCSAHDIVEICGVSLDAALVAIKCCSPQKIWKQ